MSACRRPCLLVVFCINPIASTPRNGYTWGSEPSWHAQDADPLTFSDATGRAIGRISKPLKIAGSLSIPAQAFLNFPATWSTTSLGLTHLSLSEMAT